MDKWDLMLKNELKKKSIDLNSFITRCCLSLNVNSKQVCDKMLSNEDKQDIINGDISYECLRAHIENWINTGMPYISSSHEVEV